MKVAGIQSFHWHVTDSGRVCLFWEIEGGTVMSRILPKELDTLWFMNQKAISVRDFITMTDDELESFIMMVKIDGKSFSEEA